MRTKTILAAAAFIAAGALYSTAQSNVYSLNIVGYVNVQLEANKLALLSNPLKPSDGNYDANNVLKLQDPGSDAASLYRWNSSSANWEVVSWIDGFGWDDSVNLNLGEGLFVLSPVNQTVTFVGEVQTGASTTTIPAGLSLLGNKVPVAGPAPGSTVGNDADSIYTWSGTDWQAYSYIGGYGWDSDDANGPELKVAEGFFYDNGGSALTWNTTLNP